MIDLHPDEPASLALQAGLWLCCGAVIGLLQLRTLQWCVKLFVAGRAPLLPMVLQLGRLAVLGGALAVIVSRFGAVALLMAAVGILVMRTAALGMGERA